MLILHAKLEVVCDNKGKDGSILQGKRLALQECPELKRHSDIVVVVPIFYMRDLLRFSIVLDSSFMFAL